MSDRELPAVYRKTDKGDVWIEVVGKLGITRRLNRKLDNHDVLVGQLERIEKQNEQLRTENERLKKRWNSFVTEIIDKYFH